MSLFESSRRVIQSLKKQHAIWTDDVLKYVALYGDSFLSGMEEEGSNGLYTDKVMKQMEQSLIIR